MKNLFHFAILLGLVCFAHSWANQQTRVRFAHQSPDAPNVDVYVNGHLVWPNIAFRQVTEYMEFSGDTAKIEVKVAGTNTTALSRQIQLNGKPITVAAINRLANIDAAIFQDYSLPKPPQGKSAVRAVHLSPDAPAVDVFAQVGDTQVLLFGNLTYTNATNYLVVDSGCYNLAVNVAGTRTTVLKLDNVCVESQKVYSVWVNGLVTTTMNESKLGKTITVDI